MSLPPGIPTHAELQALRRLERLRAREAQRATCPHCLERVSNLERHVRDTGDAELRPEWACAELWTRRNGRRGRP